MDGWWVGLLDDDGRSRATRRNLIRRGRNLVEVCESGRRVLGSGSEGVREGERRMTIGGNELRFYILLLIIIVGWYVCVCM